MVPEYSAAVMRCHTVAACRAADSRTDPAACKYVAMNASAVAFPISSPEVPVFAVVVVVLVVGAVLGYAVKYLIKPRSSLSFSATVLIGIGGSALGSLVPLAFTRRGEVPTLIPLVLGVLAGTVVVFLIAERLARPAPPDPQQLIADGESTRVEFKSTARHNVRTGQRDDRIESAVAKTVAGFLNGRGGALVIGVDDVGAVLGLSADLAHMKHPDVDRYQLWLSDFLTRGLGPAALADVDISFPAVIGGQVCLIVAEPSRRPVYLRPAKSEGVQFYVRIGNSTRELPVDEAVSYCADRFPARRLRLRG